MKQITRWFSLLLLLGFQQISPAATVHLKWQSELQPQRLGSQWATGAVDFDALLQKWTVLDIRFALQQPLKTDPVGLKRVLRIELDENTDSDTFLRAVRQLSGVQYAEIAPERRLDSWPDKSPPAQIENIPGDPFYSTQWFYPVMQAPAAWDVTHGNGVVVAVVDNGTDWQHPDLAANIWNNPLEIPTNGLDDDQNGFIDDVRGWDFESSDNDPAPATTNDEHGTHTSGLVAALMNNGRGVVGMAPDCQLMPIRAGSGSTIDEGLEGIVYAAHNGADVISLSWGGTGSNSYEQDVITDALATGALIVASAGNNFSPDPHFPAAYIGVLAVAATDPNDLKADFSNYGPWISVCAPGVEIMSLVPGGYGISGGTSMSTPIVAGVVALVKALHPGWSVEQLRGQVIYTADNISAKNPLYPGMLGSGRVNAYRAAAEAAPGLRVVDLSAVETSGDFDGKIDPGETADLVLSLTNDGASTSDVQVIISSTTSYLQFTQNSWIIPQFNGGATFSNTVNPYQVAVSSSTPTNEQLSLVFSVSSQSFYSGVLTTPLLISPNYANHDTGNVVFTVSEFGAFGYSDYTHYPAEYYGSGFRFPPTGSNALFNGSLLAGISTQKVSDCAFGGNYLTRYDWSVLPDSGEIQIGPGILADQEGFATYQDTVKPPLIERVGLQVRQRSLAWSSPPDNDYVILSFTLKNLSGGTLNNLYVGLYMDWDVLSYTQNEAGWYPSSALGYVYNEQPTAPNHRYYGTSLLSTPLASYRVIDRFNDLLGQYSGGISDSMKYVFMSAGMVKTSSPFYSDQATVLSSGPFSLSPEDTVQVVFTALGGETLNDLILNAEAAQTKWNTLTDVSREKAPNETGGIKILDAYPQPANGALTLSFFLLSADHVEIHLTDVLGRDQILHQGFYTHTGAYRISVESNNLASGVYWLRALSSQGSSSRKIVWLK